MTLTIRDIDLKSKFVPQVFGPGYLPPENEAPALAAILELAGNPLPQDEEVTRCVLSGRTWGGLTKAERESWTSSAHFARHRSGVLTQLRVILEPAKEHLVDLLDVKIPYRTFTHVQVANLFGLSQDRLKTLVQRVEDTGRLICPILPAKRLRERHMPKPPQLVDFLLMDRVEVFLEKWPTVKLSECQLRAVLTLANPDNLGKNPTHVLGWSRTNWSFHKLKAFRKLGLGDLPSPGPRRVFRWPDVWAWRLFVCEEGMDAFGAVDMEQAKFKIIEKRIWDTLTNSTNSL